MQTQDHPIPQRHEEESGIAIVFALFFAIVVVGIVTSGTLFMQSHQTQTDTNFAVYSQATQFARSGLTEALGWYRRQPSQPVVDFEPEIDLSASPQVLDTDEPDIGLVREFAISGSTWGRYEVWKEWAADPDATRLARRQQYEATDVSDQRGLGSAGASWRIRSIGYLFVNNDPNVDYDVAPNRLIATRVIEGEILRLIISPPGQSALSVADGNSAHINTNGRIVGNGGSGIFFPSGSGTPTTGPASQNRVTGTPALASSGSYDDSYRAVFGVTFDELRAIADYYVTDMNDFPNPVPSNSIVIADMSSMTFDSAQPLLGTGLVVLRGNVSMISGNNSNFTGFLYVEGNLIQRAPSTISGAVVVTGNFNLQGVGDYATLNFDEGALNALRLEIGQYRLSGAIRPVASDV